ncbi:Uncharacterized protein APZ42_016834 [Daphnia magna]|uniref:Uncharacterized protein n=1 Tax=Daphnia magna TaxID=35525 RepID=A0A165A6R4_9CRUS|nr:Uncharacterized protein APZ42_016834 [Daphnia magna]
MAGLRRKENNSTKQSYSKRLGFLFAKGYMHFFKKGIVTFEKGNEAYTRYVYVLYSNISF